MTAPTAPGRPARPALTLLEVLIAMAIFLLAMVVFGQMIIANAAVAVAVERQNTATRLCQAKLAEVVAGVTPLESQSDTPFDDEPDYSWSLDAENGDVDNLWNVTVHVVYVNGKPGDLPAECTISQMVLDPSAVGSTQDAIPPISSDTSSSTDGTGSSAGTAGGTTGGAGAATTPATPAGPTTPTTPPRTGGTTPAAPTGPTTPARPATPSRGS